MNERQLPKAFREIFIASCHRDSWHTTAGRSHWLESEGWQDAIAGPISSILNDGGCPYVYSRPDSSFAGVHDPSSLRTWLIEWHEKVASSAARFSPRHPMPKIATGGSLESLLAAMRKLTEDAIAMESRRWQSSQADNG